MFVFIYIYFPPILFPSSCSSASFTLLAQESKDSDRTFNRCSMANNSSRVYLYLQSEKMTEKINAASGDQSNIANISILKTFNIYYVSLLSIHPPTHPHTHTQRKLHKRSIPEVEFFSGAVAQVLSVIETHQTLGTVLAGQSRKEACRLAFITLSLIVRQQLKCFSLCFSDALQVQHIQHIRLFPQYHTKQNYIQNK